MKPYSSACDENREPILQVIKGVLTRPGRVLEIGSGTGQHAVYFGARLPHLTWVLSDLPEHHEGIRAWMEEAGLPSLEGPLALDVQQPDWGVEAVEAVFSANTAHIMGEGAVAAMFRGVGRVLASGAPFILYGPFNYGGRYTSDSNRRFDAWLKARDPASGIRDLDWLEGLARDSGMTLEADHAMPVNNRTLIWRKI